MAREKHSEKEMPVLFGEAKRPSRRIPFDQLKKSLEVQGQAFQSYSPNEEGTIYRFSELKDAIIKEQPVQEGKQALQWLIDCSVSHDGGNTWEPDWFSLNHLGKTDAHMKPVHPTWYALGNVYRRAVGLCMLGELKVGAKFDIAQTVFDKGEPVRIQKRDIDGKPMEDSEGNPIYTNATKLRPCYTLPDAPAVPLDA